MNELRNPTSVVVKIYLIKKTGMLVEHRVVVVEVLGSATLLQKNKWFLLSFSFKVSWKKKKDCKMIKYPGKFWYIRSPKKLDITRTEILSI